MLMMLRCSPWPPAPEMNKYLVKVKGMKLEGLVYEEKMEEQRKADKVMKVELKWKGANNSTILPFQNQPKNVTTQRLMAESIVWNEQFEHVCNFVVNDDLSFCPWILSFTLLYGESKSKLKVVGKISINIAELASRTTDPEIERKLPIILQVNGNTSQVTLSVLLGFIEMRTSPEPSRIVPNTVELDKEKNNEEVSSRDSNESAVVNSASKSEAKSLSVNVRPGSMVDKSRSCSDSDTRLDQGQRAGFSWKRRRLSFIPDRTKDDPILKKTNQDEHNKEIGVNSTQTGSSNSVSTGSLREAPLSSSLSDCQDDNFKADSWGTKEIISRDGQAKLKADVFFASFDQRSEKAAGESACTALVALVAHWLLANPEAMLTRAVFDNLITEGSYEWRRLCDDEANISSFPDKHLDLETVLQAEVRPLAVLHEKSFIGFFSPDKFENLTGFMSFDDIWKAIASKNEDNKPRVYIVSWNDHFFVLKAEADAYYIIDSLGERLYEGCNQAYALKFDETTLMYGKVGKEVASAVEESAPANPKESESTSPKEEHEEIICSGKECCREYIKRFLAAILLKELEEEGKKGTVSNMILHQRLQIDFHYTSSSCSGSSPSCVSYSSSSLFSDE